MAHDAPPALDVLRQLEPALVVERVAVDDRVENPPQADASLAVALELGAQRARRRTGRRARRSRPSSIRSLTVTSPCSDARSSTASSAVSRSSRLSKVEVQPRGDAAEHEVRDLVEGRVARNGERDLVAGHSPVRFKRAKAALRFRQDSGRWCRQPTTASSVVEDRGLARRRRRRPAARGRAGSRRRPADAGADRGRAVAQLRLCALDRDVEAAAGRDSRCASAERGPTTTVFVRGSLRSA